MTRHFLTLALVLVLANVTAAHCEDLSKLCAKAGCVLPVSVVIDDSRNMPLGVYAHTTVSNGVCILTFTVDTVKRREVVAHEVCHCALDSTVIGPFGYEGIGIQEQEKREERANRCARRIR